MEEKTSISNIEIVQCLIRCGWTMEKRADDPDYMILRKDDFKWMINYSLPAWSLIEMLSVRGDRAQEKNDHG